MEVGFIGLGAMGWPMALRLAQAGHRVIANDVAEERTQKFAAETGATAARSAAEVGAGAEIVITMLPTSNHVATVLEGENGLLARRRPGTLVVEMSSGAPALTRSLGQRVAEAGGSMIDAPVSGGVPRAKTGELAIMVGGEDADIERARPLLTVLGTSILPTGSLGSAHAMKALNNLVSATTFLATVEALCIGKQAGLDPARMVDILNVSTGMSNSSQKKMHQFVLSGAFNSGFGLDLMVKDLATAMGLAEETGVCTPLLALSRDIWQRAGTLLGPGNDHTALAKYVEELSSVRLGS
jgi:3-hydroxyisobutyrate dehydrogenase